MQTLAARSGLDLAIYREAHVARRIQEALVRTDSRDLAVLGQRLQRDPVARGRFRRSVAVSVTGVFRDPEQFAVLEDQLRTMTPPQRLRVWSAGCSDGSELWSVAAVLHRLGMLTGAFLLGSDVLEENIELARSGPPPQGLPPGLRELARCHFEQRDIINHGEPRGLWHVILCRNVAIYLTPIARARMHEILASALAPDGLLLLGRSERISAPKQLGLRFVAPHAYRRVA